MKFAPSLQVPESSRLYEGETRTCQDAKKGQALSLLEICSLWWNFHFSCVLINFILGSSMGLCLSVYLDILLNHRMLWFGREFKDYFISTTSHGQEQCSICNSLESYQKILVPIKLIGVLPLSSMWPGFHQGVLIGLTTQINKAGRVWLSVTYARFHSQQ